MKKVLKAMWYATLPFLIVILIAFALNFLKSKAMYTHYLPIPKLEV